MSLIEHWTITRRVPSGIPGDDWHVAEGPDPGGDPAGVKVVRVDQLAGAVEAERLLAAALEDDHLDPLDVGRAAQRALAALRGQ